MLNIKAFPFNPFAMNTYVLWDETKEGIIIDAGNYSNEENKLLLDFVAEKQIIIKGIYLTHNHIDHILGVKFLSEHFQLPIQSHPEGDFLFKVAEQSAATFEMAFEGLPQKRNYIHEGDKFWFGNTHFQVLYTPGHTDGSLCYYFPQDKKVVVGDVLFQGSIGRTDLPTGDYDILENSIRNKLYVLDDEVIVYPGHGQETTIGLEKMTNPYVRG